VHAASHAEDAHAPTADVAAAVGEDAAPCADHASDAGVQETQALATDSSEDCCQAGGCDCPCAHGSAFVAATTLVAHSAPELRGASLVLLPLPRDRLTRLLRPPA
jgi:hypothetical protein